MTLPWRDFPASAGRLEVDEQIAGRLDRWSRATPLSLFFDGDTERAFARDRSRRFYPVARFALALAVLFYLAFLAVDALSFEYYDDPWMRLLMLGLAVPSCVLVLAVTWLPNGLRWYQPAAVLSLLVNGIALACVINLGRHQGIEPPPQMLLMQVMYVFFLLGIRFALAVPVTLCIAAVYVGGMLLVGVDGYRIYEDSYLYLATVFLGAISSRLMEQAERRSWMQGRVLQHLSERDSLTGLYNHRVFFERCDALLRHAHRENQSVALAVIDLDHFKAYNDSLGHLQGDACLRRIAELLDRAARRGLDLAARLGGEEFAVLWLGADERWARQRGELLRAEIERLAIAHPRGENGVVTASIGVTCLQPEDGPQADRLVSQADRALYRAKQSGRNRVQAAWDDAGG